MITQMTDIINNDFQNHRLNPFAIMLSSQTQFQQDKTREIIASVKNGKRTLEEAAIYMLKDRLTNILTHEIKNSADLFRYDKDFIDIDIDNFYGLNSDDQRTNDLLKIITKIMNKLNSLEQYFTQKSGSILTNDEFNYCINDLKWATIDPLYTINISQWSGTRVDMAFFAKFSDSLSYDHYFIFPSVDQGSDHLPLIIDVTINDTILQSTLHIPENSPIDEMAPAISCDITKSKTHVPTSKICDPYTAIKYVQIPTFDFLIYNGQPIAYDSFDWIVNGIFTRLSDPYVTAGTTDLALGRLGTYISTSLNYVSDVIHRIIGGNMKHLENDPSGIYYVYFLYIFSYVGPDFSTIKIGVGEFFNDKAYKECYDNIADILFLYDKKNNLDFIYKIPERNVQNFLKLNNLEICVDITLDKFSEWESHNIANMTGINFDKIVDILMIGKASLFVNIFADRKILKKALLLSCTIIANCINKINEFSINKYKTKFIPEIEGKRFTIMIDEFDNPFLAYNIDLSKYHPGQNIQKGGTDMFYYNKYIKYKSKYLKLKN